MCATETYGTTPINGNAPHTDKLGFRKRYCNSTMEPTLPREAWTMNIDAVDGSVEDSYRCVRGGARSLMVFHESRGSACACDACLLAPCIVGLIS